MIRGTGDGWGIGQVDGGSELERRQRECAGSMLGRETVETDR